MLLITDRYNKVTVIGLYREAAGKRQLYFAASNFADSRYKHALFYLADLQGIFISWRTYSGKQ
jgi:hypothetical protein